MKPIGVGVRLFAIIFALSVSVSFAVRISFAQVPPSPTTLTVKGIATTELVSTPTSVTISMTTNTGEVSTDTVMVQDGVPAVYRIPFTTTCSTISVAVLGLANGVVTGGAANATCPVSSTTLQHNIVIEQATAIELISFSASAETSGSVRVAWTTAVETDHAGFFIYRRNPDTREEVLVNSQLIASRGVNGFGATYSYLDETVPPGDWEYVLEDVDISNHRQRHHPATVVVSVPMAVSFGRNPRPPNTHTSPIHALIAATLLLSTSVYTLLKETKPD